MAFLEVARLGFELPPGTDGKRFTLSNFSFSVQSGECLAVVGPSGAGKTTLLRLLAGVERPTSGQIRLDGHDIMHTDPRDRGMAMVFQGLALYPHLTVRENLTLGLRLRRVAPAEQRTRLESVVARFRLGPHLDDLPERLSGGERQRVAIGRALLQDPKVLLLDEPMSDLDAPLRVSLRPELRRLTRELGLAMVYVTHDQGEAMAMADRLMVMRDGRIEQLGGPRELYQNPENLFVAEFLAAFPPNVFQGTVLRDNNSSRVDLVQLAHSMALEPINAPDRSEHSFPSNEVTVLLRPERIQIAPIGTPGIAAVCTSVEFRGHEQFVEMRTTQGTLLRCIVSAAHRIAVGDAVDLNWDSSSFMVFSKDSGSRIAVRGVGRE